MAPSTKSTEAADAALASKESRTILMLCTLIESSDSFKADTSKIAPILGLAHAKNVPRAINSAIGPYGFEFKNGTFIKKGDGAATPTKGAGNAATPPSSSAEGAAGDKDKDKDDLEAPKKKTRARAKAAPAKGKTAPAKAAKKRKLEEVEADEDVDSAAENIVVAVADAVKDDDAEAAKEDVADASMEDEAV